MAAKTNYVYILQCFDESLYTGWTNDIEKRLKAHELGKGGKYTRGRLPIRLVYLEKYDDKIAAQKREYQIKQMKRAEKLKLINSDV
ncbi:MAG: GIY-YIG nuclease family protein [Clostridiales bacterium]|nr:GIY-YIG nuclease family protein [Clostridiales bacterium]